MAESSTTAPVDPGAPTPGEGRRVNSTRQERETISMLDHTPDNSGQQPSCNHQPVPAQIAIDDDTQTWRDVVDQLTAEMVAQLERAEELKATGVEAWNATNQADSAALGLLFGISLDIEVHKAGVRFAHVAVPDHVAHADPWMNMGSEDEPDWVRRLEGARFEVGEHSGYVLVEGFQKAVDGSVEWGVRVDGDAEDWMQADAACILADALCAAADAVESL